ncbi:MULTISPECIES: hypothetical protein [unclassified Streptomyces]|uniref:hypothetical protein n=1 Tax=unclassified Streptomyces TaxID=2593676 RepID=UPI00345058D5
MTTHTTSPIPGRRYHGEGEQLHVLLVVVVIGLIVGVLASVAAAVLAGLTAAGFSVPVLRSLIG